MNSPQKIPFDVNILNLAENWPQTKTRDCCGCFQSWSWSDHSLPRRKKKKWGSEGWAYYWVTESFNSSSRVCCKSIWSKNSLLSGKASKRGPLQSLLQSLSLDLTDYGIIIKWTLPYFLVKSIFVILILSVKLFVIILCFWTDIYKCWHQIFKMYVIQIWF